MRRSLLAGALAAATAVIGAAAPAPARAGTPGAVPTAVSVEVSAGRPTVPIDEDLIGVNHPVPGAGPAIRALGARWARLDAWFQESTGGRPDYDCATGAWHPAGLDARVALARDEGAAPLVVVDYTPACLATGAAPGDTASYYPPDIGADQARWDRLVYAMAYHEITTEHVTAFEVWNEPDGTFWRGGLVGYEHLYQDTVTQLEKAARDAHHAIAVGGPALLFSDPAWIEPFLGFVASRRLPLDFLSWHYYANYPSVGPIAPIPAPPPGTPPFWYNPALRARDYGIETRQVTSEVRAHQGADPSLHPVLWIDEWNVDAGYDPRQEGPFAAAFVTASLASMQSAGLGRASFFFVADDRSDPLGDWGLLTSSLTPRPAWWAFLFWHELAGRQLPTTVAPARAATDTTGGVGAVASVGPGGRVSVLVDNFVPWDPSGAYGTTDPTPYDHTIDLGVAHLAPGRSYRWSESLIDGAHRHAVTAARGRISSPSGNAHVRFVLPAEGVALLTFTSAP